MHKCGSVGSKPQQQPLCALTPASSIDDSFAVVDAGQHESSKQSGPDDDVAAELTTN